ncbi:hypothetical protein [Cupriavidus necator]
MKHPRPISLSFGPRAAPDRRIGGDGLPRVDIARQRIGTRAGDGVDGALAEFAVLFPIASWNRTGQDITPEQIRDGIQKRLDAAYSEGTLLEMIGQPEQTAEVCA